jgi:hypothetical protein
MTLTRRQTLIGAAATVAAVAMPAVAVEQWSDWYFLTKPVSELRGLSHIGVWGDEISGHWNVPESQLLQNYRRRAAEYADGHSS